MKDTRAKVLGWLVVAIALPVGVMLFMDAGTYALSPGNPATGRARGCYTMLDDLLRLKRPSDTLRNVELAASLVLMGLGPAYLAFRFLSKRLGGSPPKENGWVQSRK